jgi:phenylpyruvate tautomerase PptA (4-oxalocrotonate tautomerase family)
MPNISIKLPAGVLDSSSRSRLVAAINAAAAKIERIPDDPKKRFLCWMSIDEVAAGNLTCGGADVTEAMIPVFVSVSVPIGVLDSAGCAEYVEAMHLALAESLSADQRKVVSSCIVNQVADGNWGANGTLWSLSDFSVRAGYEHLQAAFLPAA